MALAATSHPDFDDTPLYDENGDGDLANDGDLWHSHWVVLTGNEACGEGALAVKDIAEGTAPTLPLTWPGLPIFIDSPGYSPVFDGDEVVVNVPFAQGTDLSGVKYDASLPHCGSTPTFMRRFCALQMCLTLPLAI